MMNGTAFFAGFAGFAGLQVCWFAGLLGLLFGGKQLGMYQAIQPYKYSMSNAPMQLP
jgi:hypothetical protein